MTEFVDDELPLPPFAEIFGEGPLANKKKKLKTLGSRSDGLTGEETTGRWTPEEHRLFLEGIMLYGKDWKKMQPLIKTRTLVQIRTHAQKVFKKIGLKKMSLKKSSNPMEVTAAQIALLQQHLEAEDNVSTGMRNPTPVSSNPGTNNSNNSSLTPGGGSQGVSYSSASLMMPISATGQNNSSSSGLHNNLSQQHQQTGSQLNAMNQHPSESIVGKPHHSKNMIPDNSGSTNNATMSSYNNHSHASSSNLSYQGSHFNNSNNGNGNYGMGGRNAGYHMSTSNNSNNNNSANSNYPSNYDDEDDDDDLGVGDEDADEVDDLNDAEDDLLSLVHHQATDGQQQQQQYHYHHQQQQYQNYGNNYVNHGNSNR